MLPFCFKIIIISTILVDSLTSAVNNFVFDLADLAIEYESNDGLIHIEAFKSTANDLIIKKKDVDKYSQLSWVSIGYPKLVSTTNKLDLSIFRPEGFDLNVEMLTNNHKLIFKDIIKRKYNLTVSPEQISTLIPAKFECQLVFYKDNHKILINGKVIQLTRLPLKLSFSAPLKTKERILFEQRFKQDDYILNMDITCEISSLGKLHRLNTLVVTNQQINKFGLLERVFGIDNQVYVTQNQLIFISTELYQRLNIMEEFQITETQFKENFLNDFVEQTAISINQFISIDIAFSQLSKYNILGEFKPDEFNKILKIDTSDSKEYLNMKSDIEEVNKINLKPCIEYIKSRMSEWKELNLSIAAQINELNAYNQNEIEWIRAGNEIIPKSVRVTKLTRASFSKNLVFPRVRKEFYDAPFKKFFTLDSSKYELYSASNTRNDDVLKRLNLLEESLSELKQANIEYQLVNDFNFQNLTDTIETRINNLYEVNDINLNSLKYQLDEMSGNVAKIEAGSWELKSMGQNCLSNLVYDKHTKMNKHSNVIYFKSKFDKIPKVILSLTQINIHGSHHDFKLNYFADEITSEKFQISFKTWSQSCLHAFKIDWLAFNVAL